MESLSDERPPQILQGEGAGLGKLRGLDASALDAAFPEVRVAEDERVFPEARGMIVTASWKIDEDQSLPQDFQDAAGHAIVTSERLLFVSESDLNKDVAVDAACISLHAMSDEPVSVYVQIQDVQAEEMCPIELVMALSDKTDCEKLFEALSKLVTMHPIDVDDDEDGDDGGNGLGGMMVAPEIDDGATEEEREAMLQRLDNMLVVPPQYEMRAGQFDDPDEEDPEGGDEGDDIL